MSVNRNFIWQPLLAVIYIALVLWILSHIDGSEIIWAIGAGSLSSSSCIVFSNPHGKTASSKNLIVGYIIGVIVGVLVHLALTKGLPLFASHMLLYNSKAFWVLASVAVGIAMVAMILCDCLHPPAVGMSLILVLDIQHYAIIGVILIAAFILALIRHVLDPYLKDLVR